MFKKIAQLDSDWAAYDRLIEKYQYFTDHCILNDMRGDHVGINIGYDVIDRHLSYNFYKNNLNISEDLLYSLRLSPKLAREFFDILNRITYFLMQNRIDMQRIIGKLLIRKYKFEEKLKEKEGEQNECTKN